jgi:large subunit ribosomal protein L11
VPVPVVITAFADKTFKYIMKTPHASYFIKKAAGMSGGSQKPGHQHVAAISLKHLHEIALVKQQDQPAVPLESICKSLMGTCKSMGVRVVPRPEDA